MVCREGELYRYSRPGASPTFVCVGGKFWAMGITTSPDWEEPRPNWIETHPSVAGSVEGYLTPLVAAEEQPQCDCHSRIAGSLFTNPN